MFKCEPVDLNLLDERPPIPALPTSEEELGELLKHQIHIIHNGHATNEFGGEYQAGQIAVSHVIMRCPFCTMIFSGTSREGCFGGSITPYNCPNCSFPNNVSDAYFKLLDARLNPKK